MGFTYLGGNNWSDITREERFFCAELYIKIKNSENAFVRWLNAQEKISISGEDCETEWETAFEVCFYRDFPHKFRPEIPDKYSPKRTFDLCLFSEKNIIIIE